MSVLVDQDIIRFDVADILRVENGRQLSRIGREDTPVDESQFMNCFDRENAFCHVKAGNIFRERVVFDQHSHEITSREELHYKVEIHGILKRIIERHNPRRIRFR